MTKAIDWHTKNEHRRPLDLTHPALAGQLTAAIAVAERRGPGEASAGGAAPWLAVVFCAAGASVGPEGQPWYRPGALHVVPPGLRLGHRPAHTEMRLFYVCLAGPLADRWLETEPRLARPEDAPWRLDRPEAASVERLREIAVTQACATPFDGWRWLSALCALLSDLSRAFAETGGGSIRERVRRAVERDPARPWDAEELAAALGLSRPALDSAFRRETGQSLMRFVRRRRMGFARQLLEQGLPVDEVATHMRASSPFAFSRAFKSVYGHPPSAVTRLERERV